jgi:hypothetical protein
VDPDVERNRCRGRRTSAHPNAAARRRPRRTKRRTRGELGQARQRRSAISESWPGGSWTGKPRSQAKVASKVLDRQAKVLDRQADVGARFAIACNPLTQRHFQHPGYSPCHPCDQPTCRRTLFGRTSPEQNLQPDPNRRRIPLHAPNHAAPRPAAHDRWSWCGFTDCCDQGHGASKGALAAEHERVCPRPRGKRELWTFAAARRRSTLDQRPAANPRSELDAHDHCNPELPEQRAPDDRRRSCTARRRRDRRDNRSPCRHNQSPR